MCLTPNEIIKRNGFLGFFLCDVQKIPTRDSAVIDNGVSTAVVPGNRLPAAATVTDPCLSAFSVQ